MKKVKNILLFVPLSIAGIVVSVVSLPFVLVLWSLTFYKDKVNAKDYQAYLKTIEGRNFFCYNNRQDNKEFIEKKLLPQLSDEVEVVFLNGKKLESKFEKKHLSSMLYKFENYTKFPHLMKVRSGRLIDSSINNALYNTIHQDKEIKYLTEKINGFFESESV